jgi:hypothetical protein
MAATFVFAAVAGIILGYSFRAGALAVGSVLVLVISMLWNWHSGLTIVTGIAVSFASVIMLQGGYLLGLLLLDFLDRKGH